MEAVESTGRVDDLEAEAKVVGVHVITGKRVRSLTFWGLFGDPVFIVRLEETSGRLLGVTEISAHGVLPKIASLLRVVAMIGWLPPVLMAVGYWRERVPR